ncbi:MAG: FHA domain-containing protein [bacterium]|nr:FHA domain-containing protein [bacterium]
MKTALRVERQQIQEHETPQRKPFASLGAFSLGQFLATYRAGLLMLDGPAAGIRVPIDQERTTLGHGPGVDLALDDASLLGESAAIEFNGQGFSLSPSRFAQSALLGRTSRKLRDGERFRIGERTIEFTLLEKVPAP